MKKVTMALIAVLLVLQTGCESDISISPLSKWLDQKSDSATLDCVLNENSDLCFKVACYDIPYVVSLTGVRTLVEKECYFKCLEKQT